ncbi:DUF4926 domain-containing protein [Vandammella animalimorsus]|uniref:DUF4926 domain-containing protein n=1 Tax=Vandammella animalimorsus TaxID=2029117 RepID=A0A2A2AB41_9BURK|nr:DUF4926 domain-containing protein [Vandammella animalimorsus]PAT34958.1 hypothetical protein CK625_12635 [Vandammella animalimorsus]
MTHKFREFQVVKAARELPAEGDDPFVPEGCEGTVLDVLEYGYIVDFVDDEGETLALRTVHEHDLADLEVRQAA